MQITAMGMAAALLFAIAMGSAYAQNKSKGTDISPWTVTHGDHARFQKKPGALKAKNPKAKVSGEVFFSLLLLGRSDFGPRNLTGRSPGAPRPAGI